jgi:hypothetical protein
MVVSVVAQSCTLRKLSAFVCLIVVYYHQEEQMKATGLVGRHAQAQNHMASLISRLRGSYLALVWISISIVF